MNVTWFLNCRLDFIRQLYARSSAPFVDCLTKIESEEEPFVPPYSEDPEPAVHARMAGGQRFDRRPGPCVPVHGHVHGTRSVFELLAGT